MIHRAFLDLKMNFGKFLEKDKFHNLTFNVDKKMALCLSYTNKRAEGRADGCTPTAQFFILISKS
jgi:hypothetical protein